MSIHDSSDANQSDQSRKQPTPADGFRAELSSEKNPPDKPPIDDRVAWDKIPPSDQLLRLLTTQVAHDLDKFVEARERSRFRTFTVVFAILAFLGFGSIIPIGRNFVGNLVSDELDRRYSEFNERLDSGYNEFNERSAVLLEQLEFEAIYQQFIALSQSFVNEELQAIVRSEYESIMQILRRLAESPELLASRETFATFLGRVVGAVTGAERGADVDALDDLFRSTLTADSRSGQMMLIHYATAVLGSPQPLGSQPEERLDRLEVYLEAANESGFPEAFILWNLLLEFERNDFRTNEATDQFVESISYLDEPDANSLYSFLALFSDPSQYQYEVSPRGTLVATKIERLLAVYPQLQDGMNAQSPELRQIVERLNLASRMEELRDLRSGGRNAESFLRAALVGGLGDWRQLDTMTGELNAGESASIEVRVPIAMGQEYRFLGACDLGCRDLDLRLIAGESTVGEDDGTNDNPDVRYTAMSEEMLTVDVTMALCGASPCGYAVAVLEVEP